MKNVEDEDKWKCLICDPSYLKEHRALYWAIFKYHKDKKPKGINNPSASPMKSAKTSNNSHTPVAANNRTKPPVANNVKVNGQVKNAVTNSSKPVPTLKTIENVYKKLQDNNFVTVSPVNKNNAKAKQY